MENVLFARSQMAMSLAFHIVFAAVGMAMPLCMMIAELGWRRTGHREYLQLAKLWARGTAVMFAVGAVSGTVLSFELGLLFPRFMEHAGAIIGMPFSLEGFAFFTEAIFLGLYLYGRDRVPPWLHVFSAAMVAVSGVLSAVFVTIANAWMNAPTGFNVRNGEFVDIDPVAAMNTPFALHEVLHMVLAAYVATGLGVAALHAYALLRGELAANINRGLHRRALVIALGVAAPCALLQPLVGHFAGQQVAEYQPVKLAAIEQLVETQARAPIHVGPVAIPGGLSFMAFNRLDAVVQGLAEVPPDERPPAVVRPAFQVMVGIGGVLALHALWAGVALWWGRWVRRRGAGTGKEMGRRMRRFLWATVLCGPLGFVAIEAGWVVTEVGRQPWIIYRVMRTAQAVTPMPGLVVPFTVTMLVYLGLTAAVVLILRQQVRAALAAPTPASAPAPAPTLGGLGGAA
jgi:cytochrome d ubiquinol oxidase subunit I